jgi:4'-phosphopantetheinyl transferase
MQAWEQPRGRYELPKDEVHVWRTTLDGARGWIAELKQTLSVEERQRARRFRFETDGMRHIIGRGLLRILIGHCISLPANQLQFEHGPFGKPRLAAGLPVGLEFNVSHSGNLVLIALSWDRALGVDVVQMRTNLATEAIAARFFSPNECGGLATIAVAARNTAFFDCWTRKEAYLKARGDGFSLRLDQFDVSFLPGEQARLLAVRDDPAESCRWFLHALHPGRGYKAAIAVEGAGWKLRCWRWPAVALARDGAVPDRTAH